MFVASGDWMNVPYLLAFKLQIVLTALLDLRWQRFLETLPGISPIMQHSVTQCPGVVFE